MSKTAASAAISTQYGFTNGANWTVTLIFLQEDTTMTEKTIQNNWLTDWKQPVIFPETNGSAWFKTERPMMQTIYLNGHRPSAHAIMDAAYTSADWSNLQIIVKTTASTAEYEK